MAKNPESSTSRILTVFFLVIFGAILWFAAPIIFPMYRWTKVDFAAEAKKATANGYPLTEAQLRTKYKIEFAYWPRGDNDPHPYLLLKSSPSYFDVVPDDDWSVDEAGVLMRCTIIGDRTGTPMSGIHLGSNQWKDRFFKAEAWRFPPKALGQKSPGDLVDERPIFLYEEMTLDKYSIAAADVANTMVRDNQRTNLRDDDGWEAPEESSSE
jgi:hypothetical protein